MLDHVNPEHHLRSMIGYHLAWEHSLVGMVMVQGKQREVVNIGLGIKQVAVEPRDATVPAYVESLSHKVRVTRFLRSYSFHATRPVAGPPACHLTRPTHHLLPSPTAHRARDLLPLSGPRRRGRPPPALHPPRAQVGLHQGDRSADRL